MMLRGGLVPPSQQCKQIDQSVRYAARVGEVCMSLVSCVGDVIGNQSGIPTKHWDSRRESRMVHCVPICSKWGNNREYPIGSPLAHDSSGRPDWFTMTSKSGLMHGSRCMVPDVDVPDWFPILSGREIVFLPDAFPQFTTCVPTDFSAITTCPHFVTIGSRLVPDSIPDSAQPFL